MSQKVLVIRFSALGDLLLTTGPLAQLRQQRPDLEVHMLTSEIGQELFINSTDVVQTHVVPKGSHFFALLKILRQLPEFDVIIDWQGNFKSAIARLFQGCQSYVINKQSRKRRAFVRDRSYASDLKQHVVEKYYSLLQEAFDCKPLPVEALRPIFPAQSLTFAKNEFDFKNAVAIHPYASQGNKEWPHFKALCETLNARRIPVVVVGASSTKIGLPDSPLLVDLTNKTTIREMAAIIAQAKAFVSTDSGPMHMGVAVNAPTLALFGPTTKEFGFYPEFNNVRVLENNTLECRPCHVHGGNICHRGDHACMVSIAVESVVQSLEKLGERNASQ